MYNLLRIYKNHLLETYSRETASTYARRLAILFEGQSKLDTRHNLNIDKILEKLGQIKYKNHFSQSKNAFLHFCEFQNIKLSYSTLESIKTLEKNTKKKRRKLEPIEYSYIDKKIKYIRNKRLKLSYQVMVAIGFRVSELASISPSACTINDKSITFSFINKGGSQETSTLLQVDNPKLYDNLKKHIENIPSNKKIFYSAVYLQNKAKELGFKCHDLRRAFAKLEYKKSKSKVNVMEKLKHSNIKTTNIYLHSKLKL